MATGNSKLNDSPTNLCCDKFFVAAAESKNIGRQVRMPTSKTKPFSVNNQLLTVPE